jgi:DNA-binding response OmpR family regulator
VRILVLDDNPILTMVLSDHFAERGHKVVPAYDPNLGLLFSNRKYFDLMIIDFVLPGMNGIEVLELMRKKNKDTRVIIITGFPELLEKESARLAKLDVEAVIEKPFDFSELDELVERQAV